MIINPSLLNKILVFVIILFFTQITNDYSLDFNNLFKTSFSDGFSYLSIFESAPNTTQELISNHHAQRYVSYYYLGYFNHLIKIDSKLFFTVVVYALLMINFLILINWFNIFKINNDTSFLFIIIFFFNPYISRYFIHAPIMIADLIFLTGFNFLITGYISKKFILVILGCLFCSLTRQTSVLLILPLFLVYLNRDFLKRFNFKFNYFVFASITIIIINFYIAYSSKDLFNVSFNLDNYKDTFNYYSEFVFGIFYFFISSFSFTEKINIFFVFILKFLITHMFSFIMLGIMFFFSKDVKTKSYFNFKNFIIIVFILSVWIQPILSGPISSPINRLTILANGGLIILFLMNSSISLDLNFFDKIIIFLIFLISSFHHEYTNLYYINFLDRYLWLALFIFCNLIFMSYLIYFKKIKNYEK